MKVTKTGYNDFEISENKKGQFEKAIKEVRNVRISRERKENEEKYDKWFKNLTVLQQADVAYNFWDGASYEEKKEEYELE